MHILAICFLLFLSQSCVVLAQSKSILLVQREQPPLDQNIPHPCPLLTNACTYPSFIVPKNPTEGFIGVENQISRNLNSVSINSVTEKMAAATENAATYDKFGTLVEQGDGSPR
jgi:hypothetical protein